MKEMNLSKKTSEIAYYQQVVEASDDTYRSLDSFMVIFSRPHSSELNIAAKSQRLPALKTV